TELCRSFLPISGRGWLQARRTTIPRESRLTPWRARPSAIPSSGRRSSLFHVMATVQLMCARLGMVTGRGLAGAIRLRYSPWVLWPACLLLSVANVFNIGADLGHGRCDADGNGNPVVLLDAILCIADHEPVDLDFLQSDCSGLQMADAGAVRLRHQGVPGAAGLGGRLSGNVCAACGMDAILHVGAGGDPGNHDFPVPVFLAGG